MASSPGSGTPAFAAGSPCSASEAKRMASQASLMPSLKQRNLPEESTTGRPAHDPMSYNACRRLCRARSGGYSGQSRPAAADRLRGVRRQAMTYRRAADLRLQTRSSFPSRLMHGLPRRKKSSLDPLISAALYTRGLTYALQSDDRKLSMTGAAPRYRFVPSPNYRAAEGSGKDRDRRFVTRPERPMSRIPSGHPA